MHETHDVLLRSTTVDADGFIAGTASVFGEQDGHGDIIAKGAFTASLQRHTDNGTSPALLWSHRLDEPLGVWTKVVEDERGLQVEGRLILEVPKAREAHALLKAGAVRGLSIGYTPAPGGLRREGEKRLLSKIDLHEISLTAAPSRLNAKVHQVRNFATPREAEDALREAGFSKRDARALLSKGWAGLGPIEHDLAEVERITRSLSDSINRIKGIVK